VLAVLLTTSSAAVALPILQALPAGTQQAEWALTTIAWIAIADTATVLAIPLVMSTGSVTRVVTGGALVIAGAASLYGLTQLLAGQAVVRRVRAASHGRGWALDLRASLFMLFMLAWIATRYGTSVLIAGFAAGAVVTIVGEPRRVAQQLIGLAEGFFIPVFFVDLGARLDLRGLAHDRRSMALALVMIVAGTTVHLLAASIWRLPLSAGLLATAQLGVPAAVVTIGLGNGSMTAPQASGIMVAVIGTVSACALGATVLGRGATISDHSAPRLLEGPP
jgi:Kef-type K+ transport system membrane component KefB